MKRYLFTLLLTMTIGMTINMSSLAYAENMDHKIDGDQLQKEAEQIMKAEPDAKEVTVRVEVAPQKDVNAKTINFDNFDLDNDGVLSRDEVGEKLFEMFDRDGNHVIDNVEMKRPNILTFSNMKKTRIEIIDYHAEIKPTQKNVTHNEFLQASKLSRFDKNKDGLSPLDFLEMTFNQVNIKNDAVIDLYEWKRAYAKSVKPLHAENFYYNG